MSEATNPAASHHLPFFITAPGETDILLNVMVGFLLLFVFLLGVLYLRLHHLPDHIAHKGQKIQYELVAVLALISMFTHNHLFWIAGLLLALVTIPDFSTPLGRMADSLAAMAARKVRAPSIEPLSPPRPAFWCSRNRYPGSSAGQVLATFLPQAPRMKIVFLRDHEFPASVTLRRGSPWDLGRPLALAGGLP
jgi:hypothetical protein